MDAAPKQRSLELHRVITSVNLAAASCRRVSSRRHGERIGGLPEAPLCLLSRQSVV